MSEEPMAASSTAASVEPTTVPVPPRMLTPPTTAAVMMLSSRLGGTVDWITLSWVANSTAATPTNRPWTRKTVTIVRRSEIPERRAASGLPPTA
jgi:hypothetical protein